MVRSAAIATIMMLPPPVVPVVMREGPAELLIPPLATMVMSPPVPEAVLVFIFPNSEIPPEETDSFPPLVVIAPKVTLETAANVNDPTELPPTEALLILFCETKTDPVVLVKVNELRGLKFPVPFTTRFPGAEIVAELTEEIRLKLLMVKLLAEGACIERTGAVPTD